MVMTDPIADMLTRIRNANMSFKDDVVMPASSLKERVVSILQKEGYVQGYEVAGEGTGKTITVHMKYGPNRERTITGIGRQPVTVPSGVEVSIQGAHVQVKGPKGDLERDVHPEMGLVLEDGSLRVERPSDERMHRSLHGLTRTLIANMVEGVTNGYEKRLEIVGVGYRAVFKDPDIELALGFSHPVDVPAPPGIEFEVPAPNRIVIRGIDKQQ